MKVSEDLKRFIINQRWEYPFELNRTSRLYEDLGIYGDDAVDFFIAFQKEFSVDLTEFHLDRFFKDDGISLLFWKRKKVDTRKSITLEALEKAIEKGYLRDDMI